MHGAFRSHLMQQFVATARQQSRAPPMALVGWVDEKNTIEEDPTTANCSSGSNLARNRWVPSPHPVLASGVPCRMSYEPAEDEAKNISIPSISGSLASITDSIPAPTNQDHFSSTLSHEVEHDVERSQESIDKLTLSIPHRSSSRFQGLRSNPFAANPHAQQWLTDQECRIAFDCAIAAARRSMGRKRMDRISFKRLFGKDMKQLTDILARRDGSTDAAEPVACVVTLVQHKQRQFPLQRLQDDEDDGDDNLFIPLPFCPPASMRELEDYGTASAASHCIEQSLQSRGLASRLIQPYDVLALRRLVDTTDMQRIVSLVAVVRSNVE